MFIHTARPRLLGCRVGRLLGGGAINSSPPRPPPARVAADGATLHEIAEALNREPREVLRVVEQDQPGSRKRRQAKAGVDHAHQSALVRKVSIAWFARSL